MKYNLVVFCFIFSFLPIIIFAQNEKNCEQRFQQIEANKKMVTEFYQQLFGDKNPEVILKYLAEDYIQHNPALPDGRKALYDAVKVWFKDAPKEKVDLQRIAADGDLVYLHVRSKMGNKTVAVVDIFRIENGKIAEHWDVIQEVPEKSANPHPMF
ncbi:MAG TPA: nuclear transport factor 2 family protein [Bacteroidales bacterium]|nr:nuclear transport factor 2 family protein [Bacteroidales bacterium]